MDLFSASATTVSKPLAATALAFALFLGGAAFWGLDKRILGLFHDDAIYAVVGKAIAEAEGYRIVSLPTAPAQTKYPFAYSYLLSWLWLLNPSFPQNIVLLKSLNIIILVGIFFVAFFYYRRCSGGSAIAALLYGVLLCCNPLVFGFTDYVLSDLLLVLLTLLALNLSTGAEAECARSSRMLWLGVVIGLACVSRTAALPLLLAGMVHALIRSGWRAVACLLVGASVFVAPWLIWVSFHRPPSDALFAYYTAYDPLGSTANSLFPALKSHWSVVQGNAYYLADMLRMFYLTPLLPGVGFFLGFVSSVGALASARRENVFAWSFLACSIALLLFWPFHPGRYLASLAPLILLFLCYGMERIASWIKAALNHSTWAVSVSRLTWSAALVVLLLEGVWLSGYLLIRDDQTTRGLYGRRLSYSWHGFEESFAWIRAHTRPDALLATAYDPMYYLYTGRRAIRPALHRPASYFYPPGESQPEVGQIEEIKPQLVKLGINYLVVDPLDGYAEGKATLKLLDELIQSFGSQAERVFTSSDGKHRIYRLAIQ